MGGFESRCSASSSELRGAAEFAVFRGGEAAGCGMLEPLQWAACDGTVIDVIDAPFPLRSVLFWSASLSKGFERLVLDASCADEPSPDIDIAVESEPCP
jgi:hypothetical protein